MGKAMKSSAGRLPNPARLLPAAPSQQLPIQHVLVIAVLMCTCKQGGAQGSCCTTSTPGCNPPLLPTNNSGQWATPPRHPTPPLNTPLQVRRQLERSFISAVGTQGRMYIRHTDLFFDRRTLLLPLGARTGDKPGYSPLEQHVVLLWSRPGALQCI